MEAMLLPEAVRLRGPCENHSVIWDQVNDGTNAIAFAEYWEREEYQCRRRIRKWFLQTKTSIGNSYLERGVRGISRCNCLTVLDCVPWSPDHPGNASRS